jgi:Tol biopolymer transport system component
MLAHMPRLRRYGRSSIALVLALAGGCKGATAPAPNVPLAPATPNPDSSLAGRIVYTDAGDLWVYTPSTRSGMRLNVRGVNPKYSRDGTQIVFQSSTLGVAIMDAGGSGARSLSLSGGVPSFDPTGQLVAFGNINAGISRIRADGTGLVQLTSDRGIQPSWSPDGTEIAYAAPGTAAGTSTILQLFIMNADGTNSRQVLTSQAIIDVVWGPGPAILLAVLVGEFNYDLHSFDRTTGTLTQLTSKSDNDFEPSWSPDGKDISWSNLSSGLSIMKADGSGKHVVVGAGRQGSWGK